MLEVAQWAQGNVSLGRIAEGAKVRAAEVRRPIRGQAAHAPSIHLCLETTDRADCALRPPSDGSGVAYTVLAPARSRDQSRSVRAYLSLSVHTRSTEPPRHHSADRIFLWRDIWPLAAEFRQ